MTTALTPYYAPQPNNVPQQRRPHNYSDSTYSFTEDQFRTNTRPSHFNVESESGRQGGAFRAGASRLSDVMPQVAALSTSRVFRAGLMFAAVATTFSTCYLASPSLLPLIGIRNNAVRPEIVRPEIVIVVYENNVNPGGLLYLAKKFPELERHGIRFVHVGGGMTHMGWGAKPSLIKEHIKGMNLPNNTIVLVADNRDVLLNIPKGASGPYIENIVEQVVEQVNSIKRSQGVRPDAVLVSAEADCCVGALSHLSMTDDTGRLFDEHGGRDKRACGSGEQGCEWDDVNGAKNYIGGMNMLAKVRTGTDPMYKYLNMGLFLGTEAEVLKFISVLDLGAREDDQAVATVLLHERPEMIALDYGAHIFGSQQRSEGNEEGCMYTKLDASGRLMHKFTGLVPFMIHNPGQNMMIAFEGPHAGTNMVPCQKEMLGKLDFGSYQDGYFPELNDHSHNNLN